MAVIQSLLFLIVLGLTAFFFSKKAREIYKNIKRGKPEDISDRPAERWKNVFLLAFGQKKMFRNMIPALLHLCVYVAFLVTQVELIEIVIDGIFQTHRVFFPILGGLYTFVINFIEILSVLALIATFAFLARRNLLKIPRFQMDEMTGWPKLDGNLILIFEIVLVFCIFLMNGADMAMSGGKYGFWLSGMLGSAMEGLPQGVLQAMERFGWWGHILLVFGFLNYIPYSKHLHIILAFPNAYFANLGSKGEMVNMPAIMKEVQSMMDPNAPMDDSSGADEEIPSFGAKDVDDLSWKSLLDAYTCTECGRCSAACPASGTGKLLSPRKIMMDVRDRMEDLTKLEAEHGPDHKDGKMLIGDYISPEEIKACTTCNACVEECPVSISPLNIILELRRYQILEAADSPEEWNLMFTNVENNGAVWQFNPEDRAKWVDEA